MGFRAAAAAGLIGAAVATAGCGEDERDLPEACRAEPGAVLAALRAAPGMVALGGTRLSACVSEGRRDADIQTVGIAFTRAAGRLGPQLERSDAAALQLGYLTGAARAGATTTNGIHAELIRRLELAAGVGGPPRARRAAYERGVAAGERDG